MKTVNARSVWSLSLLAFALAAPGMAAVELTAPVSGTAVALVPEAQKRVMSQPTLADRQKLLADDKALRGDKLWRKACPLVLKWRGTLGERGPWKVEIGKSPDLSDARVWYFKATKQDASAGTNGTEVSHAVPMANLEIAREYYWRVTSRGWCGFECGPRHGCKESKSVVRSEIASFRTEDVAPRWIEVEGRVGNFRDFGGRRTADGRRVRQGMAYRGQGLNDNSVTGEEPGRNRLTTEDVKYLVGTLGIRTDLDLRGIGETAGMKVSPLGAGITFIHHSSQCYKGIFGDEGKKVMAQNFRVFCDRRNYPIYFHCIGGADRTGSLAYVLNGVLGVDRHDMETDWESTFYPRIPDDNPDPDYWCRESHFNNGFAKYGSEGDSWNRRIELYLLDCGVTADEIAAFRSIMLEPCSAGADEFEGYAKREMAEAVDMEAFENAGFEDVSKYGKVNENIEIGRFGFNGNGGMRERPFRKKLAWRLPFRGRLEPGRRYVFSTDVRPHGKISFQTACDIYNKKARKYVGGAWGPKSAPLADGWRHQEVDFIAKEDPDDLDYKFMVYAFVPNNADLDDPENYVDVDNISIRLDAPKWYFCNTWPTHNRIYSDNARLRCNSSFLGSFLDKDADAAYAFRLLAGDGRLLAERVLRADENGNMTADFGKIAYEGPATVEVTLYDRHSRQNLGTRTLSLAATKTPDVSKGLFVREDGVVLKDGRPFMPLGFYTGLAYRDKVPKDKLEEELKRMHDAGFDAIIEYGSYTLQKGKPRDVFYGLCEKYGVYVLPDDFKITDMKDLDARLLRMRERAQDLVRYPAVIGFYTMDEGTESVVAPLARVRRMLNEVAPSHMVNVCNIMRAAPYLPIADIQGGDSYPVSNRKPHSLASCHKRVKAMHDCAPAAIWFAPQAYNWASMVRGALQDAELYKKSGREPEENEMLAVALLMASDGVTGFFFYSHFDIFRCPVKEWVPLRWERMCRVGKVMRSLEPFIMSGRGIAEVPHRDAKDATRVAAMTDGKGAWRVIVVGLGENHETRFRLPAEYGELKSHCGFVTREGDEYVFRAKEYSCDLME